MATATTIVTRRWFLAAVAGLAPLMFGRGASAFPYEKVPGYGSRAEFKRDCKGFPGATFDEGQYSTSCTYPDGDVKVCDENGKNCTYHESADSGGTTPGPFAGSLGDVASLPDLTEQPAAAADVGQDASTAAGKAGAGAGRKGGKRRKR